MLARLALDQARRDRKAGLSTAGLVTGYRGSPITTLDREIGTIRDQFDMHDILHTPALNEDLAMTAIWGTQQVAQNPKRTHDGVFGLWYGKGPGLDRSIDALRHAAAYGASELGGVVLLVGDDHGASSSTVAHQSEKMLEAAHIPVLHPATLQELRSFGLAAIEISRKSGAWVALKCQTELLETTASVDLDKVAPDLIAEGLPSKSRLYAAGSEPPLEAEKRHAPRLEAVQSLVRTGGLDRITCDPVDATLGILATGKAWLDVVAALDVLGVAPDSLGIRIYKPALTSPMDPKSTAAFAKGLARILVVEEKGPVVEDQLRVICSKQPGLTPVIVGKQDETGADLLPQIGVIDPMVVSRAIAAFLGHSSNATDTVPVPVFDLPRRRPFFCAGCPHNTSTNLPDGSRALAGIGCHSMAIGTGRSTDDFTQMGAEGVSWQGQAPFTRENHVFANMGDGTYFHSGVLAIRSAVAAGHNITYKILFNDAVAMTGGQPHDGALSPPAIVQQLKAEGVGRTVLVSVEPERWRALRLPAGAELAPRDDLDRISRELRETPGVTAIVFDQTCATELRRRRKRKTIEPPPARAFINPLVCEGCGDCTVMSNCVAVEPFDTWQGRKRKINQSVCNIDLSCVKGFCPSFVTVTGANPQRVDPQQVNTVLQTVTLTEPENPQTGPQDILIAGIGGTGVLTVSAVIGTAAFLERCDVTLLDQSGLAQKNGAVRSHVRLGGSYGTPRPSRILAGGADTLLACDTFAAGDTPVITHIGKITEIIANTSTAPPIEFLNDRNTDTSSGRALSALEQAAGKAAMRVDARALALHYFGDLALANVILLGAAWQLGRVPLAISSIRRAFKLNGVAVQSNLAALDLGRIAITSPNALEDRPSNEKPVDDHEHRMAFLTLYQNAAWADRYGKLVHEVARREADVMGGKGRLTNAVMRNAFKLMTYKDEYEVARLHSDHRFVKDLHAAFGTEIKIHHHFAPPLLPLGKDRRGFPSKKEFGPWIRALLPQLARLKILRGTLLDPFGWTAERSMERQLIRDYHDMLRRVLPEMTQVNFDLVLRLAEQPNDVRGFGPIKEKAVQEMTERKKSLLSELDSVATHGPGKTAKPQKRTSV